MNEAKVLTCPLQIGLRYQHHVIKKRLWVLIFSFSCSELPDRGQDDAAQQSQVHGEWGNRLCPQAATHV